MRTFVAAKLHGLRVTAASVDYHGSVGISRDLLQEVDIAPYERVTIVNLNNGARWDTYALALDEPRQFSLNGGSARLGVVGDPCVVMTWQTCHEMSPAWVAILDQWNRVVDRLTYEPGRS